MRWQDISGNPNSPDVLAARRAALRKAGAGLVDDRIAYLCALTKGRRVLDIGVVDHFINATLPEEWLHGRLCEVARTCVGVDVLEDEVALLRQRGYDVRAVDLTTATLDEEFDVIVMGEIIEHVDRPGELLRNAAKTLADGGRLVLSTPNPWYANAIVKVLFGRSPFTDSADHVAWYDPSTLFELGQRCGLELSKYTGVRTVSAKSALGRLLFGVAPVLVALGANPFLFAQTIIYEFTPAAA